MKQILYCAAFLLTLLSACSNFKHGSSPAEKSIYQCDSFRVGLHGLYAGSDTLAYAPDAYTITVEGDSALCWKADSDSVSVEPSFHSTSTLFDALYNRSISLVSKKSAISTSNRFATEAYLAEAYLFPERTADSLLKRIGSGGKIISEPMALPWPVTSDRSAWAITAVEAAKALGDENLMKKIYSAGVATLLEDWMMLRDSETGLVYGAQSYLLPQPMLYPEWMTVADIYQSATLGSNVAIAAAAQALQDIGNEDSMLSQIADSVEQAMKTALWQPNFGYFGAYTYSYPNTILLQATDNMAQAEGVVYGVFPIGMASELISSTPVFNAGVPTLYPMPADYRRDVDRAIQPIVQSYWTIAAMTVNNSAASSAGLGALMRMALMRPDGSTELAAGILGTVFRGFFGMTFRADGISFNPYVPTSFGGKKRLDGFKYHRSELSLEIDGAGDSIASFKIDGIDAPSRFFPDSLAGKHKVEIKLKQANVFKSGRLLRSEPVYMPPTPRVQWVEKREARISNHRADLDYELLVNGEFQTMIAGGSYRLFQSNQFMTVNFLPVQSSMWVGFSPETYFYCPDGTKREITVIDNKVDLHSVAPGEYLVRFVYSPSNDRASFARLGSPDDTGADVPVVFLPSRADKIYTPFVTVTVSRHRELMLKAASGYALPKIYKAVIIKMD